MPDAKRKPGYSDQNRINLGNRAEVDFWCMTFKCTEGQLCAAVANVGTDTAKLQAYFNARRQLDAAAVARRLGVIAGHSDRRGRD